MTDQVLQTLKNLLDNGDYYGAHQMYLSVCNRYIKSCKIDEAVELLLSGIKRLCEHQQYGSGVELSSVLFKTWTHNRTVVDDTTLEKTFQILECFPSATKEFLEVAKHSLKWTTSCGQTTYGEPALHHQVGLLLAKNNLEEARHHLLLGTTESAESLALLSVDTWNKEKSAPCSDQILLQPILSYLGLRRIAHALAYFKTIVSQESLSEITSNRTSVDSTVSSTNSVDIFDKPLLNLAQLLIFTCQRGPAAAAAFKAIRQQYYDQLSDMDRALEQLDKIGESFFELHTPKPQNANPLQSLLSSFMTM